MLPFKRFIGMEEASSTDTASRGVFSADLLRFSWQLPSGSFLDSFPRIRLYIFIFFS